ncbi:HET-domain-containing protein [Viridothelium virens]|uniref:HET-domain-containing protein n=1 Tax=Viridothelium virens TaxID=1048519 RepID=A0A6A6GSC8_VIRVR|nr:HET-domain-containing protein [Viridothelium virens]
MRLLTLEKHGNVAWAEFNRDETPPYAILSHRWGIEEVSFLDLVNRSGKSKVGYHKIVFYGEQAALDGLQYFWVDTCCIDKRNITELTEAINSMFRWYRNATKCYVYLSDVSTSTRGPNVEIFRSTWEPEFRSSKWFTRGWTLQELLAPVSVIFYSSQYERLGDKHSLIGPIHEITGIPRMALDGHPLDTFSVTERMAWASKRQTTEEEDSAYCLLGIFSIFMPLIYGEGRENALRWLEREVDGVSAACLGGIGKTQLALKLAYRTQAKYKNCSVFWIPATDMDSLHQAYQDIAEQLGIAGWDEEKADVKKLVQAHLSQAETRPWLLVFDNADEMGMWIRTPGSEPGFTPGPGGLKEYLPKSKQGCIVFTTRDKKTAIKLTAPNVIELPEMEEDGAIQLLQKSVVNPGLHVEQHAKALVRELTYLPLAIVQAVAYINENSMALADYLSLLREQEEAVIELLSEAFEDDWRYPWMKNPVATTWLISFEQIRRRDALAADYLSFIACIDRKDIPQSLLPAGSSRRQELEAIGTLRAYSFITRREQAAVFDLHRLVHLATRSWLREEGELSHWTKVAITRLDDVFPNNEYQKRAQWRILLQHASYALQSGLVSPNDNRKLSLACKYGMSMFKDGRYSEAEAPLQEVVQVRESMLGLFQDAEELGIQVIEARRRLLGSYHLDVLTVAAKIVLLHAVQGKWNEAERLEEQTTRHCLQVLGAEHAVTLECIQNLAITYMRQDTLISMFDLAWAYKEQGRCNDAEKLDAQVMEIRIKVLGKEHPDTLESMAMVAKAYMHQGRWNEAEEITMRVVDASSRVLGTDHLATLRKMSWLGLIYSSQGRLQEAEDLAFRVVEMTKRTLGKEHPDTLESMTDLASTYRKLDRWQDAEALDVEVMQARKTKLGLEHPNTLISIASLALTYRGQGRWKEAEELGVIAMETRKKVLGEEHPDTLISMSTLAIIWKGQGHNEEAVKLMNKCVQLRTQILGPSHHLTLSSMKALNDWKLESLDIA